MAGLTDQDLDDVIELFTIVHEWTMTADFTQARDPHYFRDVVRAFLREQGI